MLVFLFFYSYFGSRHRHELPYLSRQRKGNFWNVTIEDLLSVCLRAEWLVVRILSEHKSRWAPSEECFWQKRSDARWTLRRPPRFVHRVSNMREIEPPGDRSTKRTKGGKKERERRKERNRWASVNDGSRARFGRRKLCTIEDGRQTLALFPGNNCLMN